VVNFNYTFARYADANNLAIDGKEVEYTPPFILRSSLSLKHKVWGISVTASYTARQYSDATNAVQSSNGNYGIIPASFLLDFSAYRKIKMLELTLSVKNVTNQSYFTQRSEGYSGPGIIPGTPVMVVGGMNYRF
jgi:Fe(3+) dicitrate transport protein